MDENETPLVDTSPSTLDKVKTVAEVVVITYTAITAAKGLYDLAKDWKDVVKEKRSAKKAKQEEE